MAGTGRSARTRADGCGDDAFGADDDEVLTNVMWTVAVVWRRFARTERSL